MVRRSLFRARSLAVAVALLSLILLPVGQRTAAAAGDPYRPAYHYTAAKNFMNDPNGLIYRDGVYHLYYQYNPSGTTAGNGSWGHATSTDLVHWKRQPLAISTDANEDVWSGSVVYDKTNSSGFGTKRKPAMVAIYTSYDKATGIQRQSLAYSRDDGFTWTKYAGNPVIDIGSHDFRDPKVFWDTAHGGWRMVVALAAEKKVSIYSSADLKTWKHESDFGPAGAASAVWECPDLFPLALDGRSTQQRWVLSVSVSGKTQYFVGTFDGTTFSSPDADYAAPAGTVLNDFEGADYGDWTTTGTAFGSGPVADGPDVTGRHGEKVVDSFGGSDSATGTLTSPTFTVSKPYLNFLIGGGNHPHVDGGSDGPPPGTTFADFEGSTYGDGWTATGDFVGEGPASSTLPGQLGSKVLDTCVKTCDPAVGTISSPDFTIDTNYIDLLVGGGNHPMSGTDPTAVNLVVDGEVVATATGKNSGSLDWVAWDTSALKGRTAHIEVVDQRTADWGHLMVDNIVFADVAAAPWSLETTANLIVDGKVVRSSTGNNGPGLDWASWNLTDLQGKQARIQLVDTALADWGHLIADYFVAADQPALSSAQRVRWIDHGNDFYAAVTFNDLPQDQRTMIGWMGNWDYANSTPTGTWRGQQSIPRRLSLRTVDGRPTLISTPVSLSSLVKATTRVRATTITAGTHRMPVSGRSLLIETTLHKGTATDFGLDVRVGGGQRVRIGYDTTTEELYVDRTQAGRSDFSPLFPAVHRAELPLHRGELGLTIAVDSSSVEVFSADGTVSISDLVYPDPTSTGVALFADGGTARLDGLTVRTLGGSITG
ncbi:GH32 C-terminal domain-containing protein [Microlunatus ginsengisoli]|uniref:Levanase n=1 Tax=Microlunatus ginsengisoli TaxID=363863 RepID=A0ABP6ZWC3_9ACTN